MYVYIYVCMYMYYPYIEGNELKGEIENKIKIYNKYKQ